MLNIVKTPTELRTGEHLVIYHGNCADGFAAAWVTRKFMQEHTKQYNAYFLPGVYQTPPPDCTGLHVTILDFSYKLPVMDIIAKQCSRITWIDHHKTAIEDMLEYNWPMGKTELMLDKGHSGAMLAWQWYYGKAKPPKLLEHIEDRDLWKFALPGTREIQANLFSFPYDFDVWDKLMNDTLISDHILAGRSIERKHHKDIEELIKVCVRPMWIDGNRVPVCNLPYTMASDACHMMCKLLELGELQPLFVDLPTTAESFAATYYDKQDARVFSLRSLDHGADVSVVAAKYGGGGHAHAAGFTVSKDSELGRA